MNKVNKIMFWKNKDFGYKVDYITTPVPAKNKIPEWYLNSKITSGKKSLEVVSEQSTNVGIKGCVPFLDAFEAGYILELSCDVIVKQTEGFPDFSWSSPVSPLTLRPLDLVEPIPLVPGFTKFFQAWLFEIGVLVPNGYSLLVTHPLNHYELPFISSSAIVDADGGLGNGFEGILKKGTPIIQLIPFKRENWKSEIIEPLDKRIPLWIPRSMVIGWYKKNIWKKKRYI
jgi:hypothetical protein